MKCGVMRGIMGQKVIRFMFAQNAQQSACIEGENCFMQFLPFFYLAGTFLNLPKCNLCKVKNVFVTLK